MQEIYWHVTIRWLLISQQGLQDNYHAHRLCQHITPDKRGHLLGPRLLHTRTRVWPYCLAVVCQDMKVYTILVKSTANSVNRQLHNFTSKLIEATLAPISSPTCNQTCGKTNPRLINRRSNAHRSEQSLKNSIQLSSTWL